MSQMFGLTAPQLEAIQKILAGHGKDKNRKIRVFIFGSRARNTHRPFSDVDLIIESAPPLTDLEFANLKDEFEESSLPFKFDLVAQDHVFEPYREAIEEEKRLLFDWF